MEPLTDAGDVDGMGLVNVAQAAVDSGRDGGHAEAQSQIMVESIREMSLVQAIHFVSSVMFHTRTMAVQTVQDVCHYHQRKAVKVNKKRSGGHNIVLTCAGGEEGMGSCRFQVPLMCYHRNKNWSDGWRVSRKGCVWQHENCLVESAPRVRHIVADPAVRAAVVADRKLSGESLARLASQATNGPVTKRTGYVVKAVIANELHGSPPDAGFGSTIRRKPLAKKAKLEHVTPLDGSCLNSDTAASSLSAGRLDTGTSSTPMGTVAPEPPHQPGPAAPQLVSPVPERSRRRAGQPVYPSS